MSAPSDTADTAAEKPTDAGAPDDAQDGSGESSGDDTPSGSVRATSTRPSTRLRSYLQTDVGIVREHNEDSAWADEGGVFFIVADGMGGHAAGEVASAMAVELVGKELDSSRAVVEEFARAPSDDGRQALVQLLETSVRRAHQAVFERGGREADKKGMGTTLEVVLVADGEAFVAHVGDSRTYLVRGGAAAQVTSDHTVAAILVSEGKLTVEEARQSLYRTVLINAIGISQDVTVEFAHFRLRRGDKVLLCSDGLHDYFPSDDELAEILGDEDASHALGRLVETAKQRGGHDNITGIVVDVVEGAPTVEEEAELARREAAVRRSEIREETEPAAPPDEMPEDNTSPVEVAARPRDVTAGAPLELASADGPETPDDAAASAAGDERVTPSR